MNVHLPGGAGGVSVDAKGYGSRKSDLRDKFIHGVDHRAASERSKVKKKSSEEESFNCVCVFFTLTYRAPTKALLPIRSVVCWTAGKKVNSPSQNEKPNSIGKKNKTERLKKKQESMKKD